MVVLIQVIFQLLVG